MLPQQLCIEAGIEFANGKEPADCYLGVNHVSVADQDGEEYEHLYDAAEDAALDYASEHPEELYD